MKRTYRYQPVGPGTVFPERGGPELATASLNAPEAAPYVLPGSRTRAASTLTDPASRCTRSKRPREPQGYGWKSSGSCFARRLL